MASLVSRSVSLSFRVLSSASQARYKQHWQRFACFCNGLGKQFLPAAPFTVTLFITHLEEAALAPSTIRSILSAVSFYHTICHYSDPVASPAVTKFIKGLLKSQSCSDCRSPLSVRSLSLMLRNLHLVCEDSYMLCMYKALFALMFYAFLRVSEVSHGEHNILFQHLTMTQRKLVLRFTSFKHSNGRHFSLNVLPTHTPTCPHRAMSVYLQSRGQRTGPLFCLRSGAALTSRAISKTLKDVVSVSGLPEPHLTSHSFRIGAATWASKQGYAAEQIRLMGRWKSDAFLKYIRPSSFHN